MSVSLWRLLALAACFYGLYILPGLVFFKWLGRAHSGNSFFSASRILLSFAGGMCAHVLATLLQKQVGLAYTPLAVLIGLALGYAPLLLFRSSLARLWDEKTWDEKSPWTARFVLFFAIALGIEMTLRAWASRVSLAGDAFIHLMGAVEAYDGGPLPDGIPFYSTFVVNLQPMAFHALWASLKTFLPFLTFVDLLRYFSAVMTPIFVLTLFAFFRLVANNAHAAALASLASLFVSGGGLSLEIPVFYFPWYWGLSWCLSAAIFYLVLSGAMHSSGLSCLAGLLLGAGALIHPMLGLRVAPILVFFLGVELCRRLLTAQATLDLLRRAAVFGAAGVVPVSCWLVPLLLKYGWEERYSYAFILNHFSDAAPRGVAYLRLLSEEKFSLTDLAVWSLKNAGLMPCLLFPVGLYALGRQRQRPVFSLLSAWLLAMAAAVLFRCLANPYRYFEYFFFALLTLSALAMGFCFNHANARLRRWALACSAVAVLLGLHRDFHPKYRLALEIYGRDRATRDNIKMAELQIDQYLQAKRQGKLDEVYGSLRNYLWSRQKKVWEIYLRAQRAATKQGS